ncbi:MULTISPECIES: 30S ribosomal protein S6 [Dehalobacter]|uniref:Small ribosomal subunit protein bS6 n=2 Tax=Dehalobacter restrictus TaxID=55583 RepID=A0A857DPB0_9FIRM|nr:MULTISPECIES: 30S ribosomal protein S6 [Dehalobacter]AFV03990.1 SSU ribosomal protein S6p [Dehalobacter sp. DCA]AFV06970.1 SSU ribosomal protein S6p [Dehalobacter sp. CF]AHF11164.1 30S ribosomal protein S6 [Dehalobacter restrictus DSM 9455]EQB21559.1 SSU ribosomal protein S6p [Dehalobacter sp. UNSWDHB]MCG1024209.1 30S ribosomal protein S6 [Dehalobacter sp.]
MQAYEVMYIIRPDLDDEASKANVQRFEEIVNANGGTDLKVDIWGKRRLAYEVKKFNEGVYVLMNFNGEARTVDELERLMKISDAVIRFMTTKKE